VFEGSRGALIATTNVDSIMQTVGRLIVNPNTNRLYVEAANPSLAQPTGIAWTVEVFDGATLAHLSSIADRKGPFAVNTVTNMVYAANSAAGASAIDGLAPEQVSVFGGSLQVSALAVDQSANNVLIGSYSTYLGVCCTPTVPVYGVASGTISLFHQDPATYLVQGLVTSGGVAQAGITVTVSGANGRFSQVTGPNGIFAGRLVPGVYTVTPSSPAFAFAPASQTITLGQIDQTVPTIVATPIFHINGVVLTQGGTPVSGVTVTATGTNGSASGVTNASGLYSIPGLPAGTYTVAPVSPANFYSPASQSVQINKTDVRAAQITVNPSLQITGFTLRSSLLGVGVQATATVSINVVAPSGGVSIALSSSNTKTVKPPSTVTIPAGSSTGTFIFSGGGIGIVTLTATYSGQLAVQPSSASGQVSIVATDTIHIVSATWSTSTHVLNVSTTGTNPNAVLTVTLASNGQTLGIMTSAGNGNFTLQTQVASQPSSINVKSSLGGSSGQGVSVIP
ncbi:MAG TPA: carboxypeptidase-like regulatory domain-containing protein, partial [Bryobacteraceae bacterium]